MTKLIWILTFSSLLIFASSSAEQHLTSYNDEEARMLINLAAAAYSSTPEKCIDVSVPRTENWYVVHRADQLCDAQENTCSDYVTCSDIKKQCVIVFRGSTSKSQLLQQGLLATVRQPEDFMHVGKVHPYFYLGLKRLWEPLHSFLKDPKFQSYNITFTGHSLGGALASLAALKTAIENLRNSDQIRVLTFGAPRIGDRKFSEAFDERIKTSFRVVHGSDMVPHLPPCETDEKYKGNDGNPSKPCYSKTKGSYHHGIEIWYQKGMEKGAKYVECLGMPVNEDFNCSDSLIFNKASQYAVYITDHQNYFGHHISKFGKAGCNTTLEKASMGASNRVLNFMSKHSSKLQAVGGGVKKFMSWIGLGD